MRDVVGLIIQDHREVERLFDELKNYSYKRAGLVPVLTTLLTAHRRAEDAEVFSMAAEWADRDVAHSDEEDILFDQLVANLARTDPESPAFDEALADLVVVIERRVHAEESLVLPQMRESLSPERRDELGRAFLRNRGQVGEQPGDGRGSELIEQTSTAGI